MKSEFVTGPVETYETWSEHHLQRWLTIMCMPVANQRPSSIWSLLPGSMHDWNFVNHFLDTKYLNSLDCMKKGNTKVKNSSTHTKQRTKNTEWLSGYICLTMKCVIPENIHTSPTSLKIAIKLHTFLKIVWRYRTPAPPSKSQSLLWGENIFWNCTMYITCETRIKQNRMDGKNTEDIRELHTTFECDILFFTMPRVTSYLLLYRSAKKLEE